MINDSLGAVARILAPALRVRGSILIRDKYLFELHIIVRDMRALFMSDIYVKRLYIKKVISILK